MGLLVCLDFIIHHKVYDAVVLQHAVVGFFPEANLYTNINSPLWYFSSILFYYLLFPLLWIKKMPYVTAFLLFIISYLVLTRVQLPVTQGVLSLYKVHVLALPLGIIGGWIIFRWGDVFKRILQKSFYPTQQKFWLISLRWAIIGALVGIIYYLGINSGVGKSLRAEQIIAVYTTLAIITVFIIKYTRFKILELWGVYSYEIYLLHWPLMYRFDLLYKILPPSLATVIYLFIFIGLGFVLQRLSWWSEKNIFRFMTRSA